MSNDVLKNHVEHVRGVHFSLMTLHGSQHRFSGVSMLKVGFFTLRPDKVTAFNSWMEELQRRSGEVLETFRTEGTRHELSRG